METQETNKDVMTPGFSTIKADANLKEIYMPQKNLKDLLICQVWSLSTIKKICVLIVTIYG
jgi:hypothetical protein